MCLHEPFGPAYYRGADRRTTRPDENELEPDRTYNSTWGEIQGARRFGRVFSKDFPNYIMHLVDPDFLDAFQHTFLIRDPAKALASMYNQWDEFTMDEAGYEALHEMFRIVSDRYGTVPPIIDSDDLLDDTPGVVRAYCEAVGLEFKPEAMEWDEGDRNEVRWYGGGWHDSLQASTGLSRQQTQYKATIADVPFLQDMYARCQPLYDELHSHRMTVSD